MSVASRERQRQRFLLHIRRGHLTWESFWAWQRPAFQRCVANSFERELISALTDIELLYHTPILEPHYFYDHDTLRIRAA